MFQLLSERTIEIINKEDLINIDNCWPQWMNRFYRHIWRTRKLGLVLILLFMLMPIVYTIACINRDKFEFFGLIQVTLMALGFGGGSSFLVMLKDFLLTEKLLKRLKKLEIQNIGDDQLVFVDNYTGWERRLEFHGTFKKNELLIFQKFKESWLWINPYLCVFAGSDLDMVTEIKVDKHLTTQKISSEVDDALLPIKAIKHVL